KDPPRKRVEKYWDEMVNDDSHNRPFAGGERIEDLADALMNQQSCEQRSSSKAKQPYGYLDFARRFHRVPDQFGRAREDAPTSRRKTNARAICAERRLISPGDFARAV